MSLITTAHNTAKSYAQPIIDKIVDSKTFLQFASHKLAIYRLYLTIENNPRLARVIWRSNFENLFTFTADSTNPKIGIEGKLLLKPLTLTDRDCVRHTYMQVQDYVLVEGMRRVQKMIDSNTPLDLFNNHLKDLPSYRESGDQSENLKKGDELLASIALTSEQLFHLEQLKADMASGEAFPFPDAGEENANFKAALVVNRTGFERALILQLCEAVQDPAYREKHKKDIALYHSAVSAYGQYDRFLYTLTIDQKKMLFGELVAFWILRWFVIDQNSILSPVMLVIALALTHANGTRLAQHVGEEAIRYKARKDRAAEAKVN